MSREDTATTEFFIQEQKSVRADIEAALHWLESGHATFEGRLGGFGLNEIQAGEIAALRDALRHTEQVIAEYEGAA